MIRTIMWLAVLFSGLLHAEENPILRVAINSFSPPYVIQRDSNHFYGFDIAMMHYVCLKLQRRCEYITMRSTNFIKALDDNEADVAIGTIIIMPEKLRYVAYSMPYLVSQAQYVASKELAKQPFNTIPLDEKIIGAVRDSAFVDYLHRMHHDNVVQYDSDNQMFAALEEGRIDLAIANMYTAEYWNHASETLKTIGPPFTVGFGLGIATSLYNKSLLTEINAALISYQNSPEFKRDFDLYLQRF